MKILFRPDKYSQQRQREKKRWIYPVKLAMQATHYHRLGNTVIWDQVPDCEVDRVITEPETINFLNLPYPDRILTNALNKKYQNNGNFKYRPGTYIQVADGCWHGKCTFCVEKNKSWKVRELWHVMQELEEIERLGFKEVFDDSGTFPTGEWLDKFLKAVSDRNFGFKLGCNMRLVDVDYSAMYRAGFRMLLFGVESSNQKTLDRIQKGVKVEDIKYLEKAKKEGIEPHIAVMFGYPWETKEDVFHTLTLVHNLLKSGIASTAQASFYNTDSPSNPEHKKYVDKIYDVALSPKFWINKIKSIKSIDDLNYFLRQIREGLFHG